MRNIANALVRSFVALFISVAFAISADVAAFVWAVLTLLWRAVRRS